MKILSLLNHEDGASMKRIAICFFAGAISLALLVGWAMPSNDDRAFDGAFVKMVGAIPFDSPAAMKQAFPECGKFDIPAAWNFPGRFPSYECVLQSEVVHTLFISRNRELGQSSMSLSPSPKKCVGVRSFKNSVSNRWHVESPDIKSSTPSQSQETQRWYTWDNEDGSYGYSAIFLPDGVRPVLLAVEAYHGCIIQATLSLR